MIVWSPVGGGAAGRGRGGYLPGDGEHGGRGRVRDLKHY